MKHKTISNWQIFRQFFWLEYKKWTRLLEAFSKPSLLVYFLLFLGCLMTAVLRWYHPLILSENPRASAIVILLVLLIGILILSYQSLIVPTDEGGLFSLNPFNFNLSDVNAVSQTSGRPLLWALIGWFRTSLKVLGFVLILSMIILSYGLEFHVPLFRLLLAVITLFLGIQLLLFTGAFVYTFVEEILEKLRPRWREESSSKIISVGYGISAFVIFGGLVAIYTVNKTSALNLDGLILNFWFIPPFNIIYLVLASLSKTWPQTLLFPALFTFLIEWVITNALFFLILSRIDPLARLYERQFFVQSFSSNRDVLPSSFLFISLLTTIQVKLPSLLTFGNRFTSELESLLKKDLLFLDKFRISLIYSFILIFYIILLIFWFVSEVKLYPERLLLGTFLTSAITLLLWIKESRTLLRHFAVSLWALIFEKWLLSFILVIALLIPLLLMQQINLVLIGFSSYLLCFVFGFIFFQLKPSTRVLV